MFTSLIALLLACNPDPGFPDQGVGFRAGGADGNSGERGTIKISEVLWSGSVKNDGTWDPTDVFVELRNEGTRAIDLTGWQIEVNGSVTHTSVIPQTDAMLGVGEHFMLVASENGCFPSADVVLPNLTFSQDEPFEIVLLDRDDRLLEPVGSTVLPPFAGGYDLVESRSMERIELLFGAEGTSPTAWHYYTTAPVEVPNNDRVSADCQQRTLASPGRANSPDYSGASASGSLE